MDWFDLATFVALFALMLSIGTALTVEDFQRVARFPRLVVIGSVAQFLLLPVVAGVIVALMDLRADVVVGVLILGACPGGGFSNLYTYAGGGHLALSVTLTAVTCLVAVLVMPEILWFEFLLFSDRAHVVPVPALQMFAELLARVLAPIAVGMLIRRRWPEWTEKHADKISRGTLLLMAAMIPAVLADQGVRVLSDALDGILPALIFTKVAMLLGLVLGILLSPSASNRFTLAIEFGVRNVAVAVVICWSVLKRPELLAYCLAYTVVQIPLALLAIYIFRKLAARPSDPNLASRSSFRE